MKRRSTRKNIGRPFKKGNPGGPGRPPKNPLQRAIDREIRAYAKQHAESFKEACNNLLPVAMDRAQEILNRKGTARENSHLRLLNELADRVFGRAPIAITGASGGPLLLSFTDMLHSIDGEKKEKFYRSAK